MNKFYAFVILHIIIFSNFLYSQDTNDNDILSSRLFFIERDIATTKMNIYTDWKETYKYLRDNRFRFYKKAGRTITLDFRYRYTNQIFVTNGTPIVFTFEDGSEVQLSNVQKAIYNPYLMSKTKFYDIEVKYKFEDDSQFENFASKPISNIRFNFINEYNEEAYEDIYIASFKTTNWQNVFNAFKQGMDKLDEIQSTTNTANTNN